MARVKHGQGGLDSPSLRCLVGIGPSLDSVSLEGFSNLSVLWFHGNLGVSRGGADGF